MENADVRRRVRETIGGAKQRAADRRRRLDDASQAWAAALPQAIVPVVRQMAQALAAEGVRLQVSTPEERVLIAFEHRPGDHVELALEALDEDAVVMMRTNRGREGVTEERVLATGARGVESLAEERVLDALLEALTPWLAR